MKTWISILTVLIFFASCTEKATLKNQKLNIEIIPTPKKMVAGEKALVLVLDSGITSPNEQLEPFLKLFQSELQTLTGFELPIVTDKNKAAITFQIAKNLAEDEYRIAVEESVLVNAGSFQALAMARTTLLQLAKVDGEELLFPQLTLNDLPDAKYRGLLIDLARNWHSMETVKKLIYLASYYKTNYVQLHFTDDQSYTLPSKKYPKLPTPDRHYSFEDLDELERYSQMRGVTIIPELEMPGHAKSFIDAYPEIFGIKDAEENPYIINMGKEEVYNALEELIAEVASIFKASPYFHIGGDEARFTKVMDDPEVNKYMKEKILATKMFMNSTAIFWCG